MSAGEVVAIALGAFGIGIWVGVFGVYGFELLAILRAAKPPEPALYLKGAEIEAEL